MVSTDPVRRLAVVMARYGSTAACPPGVDRDAFTAACLADSYEVTADLAEVDAGICGPRTVSALLWPGHHLFPESSVRGLAGLVDGSYAELALLPADAPDLPGLVVAKVFRALRRADVVVAPERGGGGVVVLGVRLPWPEWLPEELDLDHDPTAELRLLAPRPGAVATAPPWHRLRTRGAVTRLDPRLEGWDETRALLSEAALRGG